METINKKDINKGGKALHILKNGKLVFNNEGETNVLMDYCIHNTPRPDKNYVDLFLEKDPSPDYVSILNSLKDSRFSIFRLMHKRKGFGVLAEDTLSGDTVLILDKALSRFGQINLYIAGRFLPMINASDGKEAGILSGASLPINENLYPLI
ncbi:unnamed protein product [marine sediment metagenome]|uniref:Uncharacterized protein n=1 Tax=marine sediment metagenome TaxID=412755 RepID=X1SR25_9ZZZZ